MKRKEIESKYKFIPGRGSMRFWEAFDAILGEWLKKERLNSKDFSRAEKILATLFDYERSPGYIDAEAWVEAVVKSIKRIKRLKFVAFTCCVPVFLRGSAQVVNRLSGTQVYLKRKSLKRVLERVQEIHPVGFTVIIDDEDPFKVWHLSQSENEARRVISEFAAAVKQLVEGEIFPKAEVRLWSSIMSSLGLVDWGWEEIYKRVFGLNPEVLREVTTPFLTKWITRYIKSRGHRPSQEEKERMRDMAVRHVTTYAYQGILLRSYLRNLGMYLNIGDGLEEDSKLLVFNEFKGKKLNPLPIVHL